MPRPKLIRDEDLLEIAQEYFLRDGFRASTTAIAAACGVSEATLYKRYSTKMGLFRAAMGLPECEVLLADGPVPGEGEMTEQLRTIASCLLTFFEDLVPRIAILSGVPGFSPKNLMAGQVDPPPLAILRRFTDYLEAEMALGRLRPRDPEVMARSLMGSLYNFAFFKHMGLTAREPIAKERFIDELIALIWEGVQPLQEGEL